MKSGRVYSITFFQSASLASIEEVLLYLYTGQ